MSKDKKNDKKETHKKEDHTNHATHKVTKEDVKNNPGEGLKVGEEIGIPLQSEDMSLPKKDSKNAAGESITHKEEMEEANGLETRPEEGKALNSESHNLPSNIGDDPEYSDPDKNKDADKETVKPEDIDVSAKNANLPEYETNAAGQSKTHTNVMTESHGSEKRAEKGFNEVSEEEIPNSPHGPHSPGTETSSDQKDKAGQSKVKTDMERESEKPS